MSEEAFIFEVSESSFPQSVLFNSHKLPVVVEFMGVWSEPCVLMADLFSKLAQEFAGEFVFAKVDIDEQKALREEYNIQNVPTTLVFKDGEMVRREEGQLQEVEGRSLLKDFDVFRQSDAMREEARNKHLTGDTQGAILLLTKAIQSDPTNTRIAMDMTQIFIDLGEVEQAKQLFAKLPESDTQTEMGKSLSGQLSFAELAIEAPQFAELEKLLADNNEDFQAHFDMAIRQVAMYNYDIAIDHLFSIMEHEPEFREGAAKEMIITITNMLAPVNHDQASAFRQRLANLLAH